MTDWVTFSSLATAGATLVLAVATFSSVRSANRVAQSAEQALQVGLRPVLFPSRPDDPTQTITWGDNHQASLGGGRAVLEAMEDGTVYLAMSLRNVGSGIAVLHGWRVQPATGPLSPTAAVEERRAGLAHPDLKSFRLQGRDLYVPAGDHSFWQAAAREPDDPDRPGIIKAIEGRQVLTIDLLYGDHEGGQRTISRFSLTPPLPENESRDGSGWRTTVLRHWNLDRRDPR
jgi:hypothetical protein